MIIRIDDFPTGVRPLTKTINNLFFVLDHFEKNKLQFHLGIVPKLLKDEVSLDDQKRLKSYKYLVPCQHGYDHRYYEMSRRLKEANDPCNNKTVGIFNEFENKTTPQVTELISKGRYILEQFFDKEIEYYIPVCNYVDQALINSLRILKFKNLFTYNGSIYTGFNCILARNSGRLYELKDNITEPAICLHVTWEVDYIKQYGYTEWIKHFNKLLK